jgi:hypothetical protein
VIQCAATSTYGASFSTGFNQNYSDSVYGTCGVSTVSGYSMATIAINNSGANMNIFDTTQIVSMNWPSGTRFNTTCVTLTGTAAKFGVISAKHNVFVGLDATGKYKWVTYINTLNGNYIANVFDVCATGSSTVFAGSHMQDVNANLMYNDVIDAASPFSNTTIPPRCNAFVMCLDGNGAPVYVLRIEGPDGTNSTYNSCTMRIRLSTTPSNSVIAVNSTIASYSMYSSARTVGVWTTMVVTPVTCLGICMFNVSSTGVIAPTTVKLNKTLGSDILMLHNLKTYTDGSVIISGSYNSAFTISTVSIPAPPRLCCFIAKLDSNLNLVWQATCLLSSGCLGTVVEFTGAGNIIAALSSDIDASTSRTFSYTLNNGVPTNVTINTGNCGLYILRLNTNGTLLHNTVIVQITSYVIRPYAMSIACIDETFALSWKFTASSFPGSYNPYPYTFSYVYGIDAVKTSVTQYDSIYFNHSKAILMNGNGCYDHGCITCFNANHQVAWEAETLPDNLFNAGGCLEISINRTVGSKTFFVTCSFSMYCNLVFYCLYTPSITVDNLIPLIKDQSNGNDIAFFVIASDGTPVSFTAPADPIVSISSTSNTLSWTSVPGATSYTLFVYTGATPTQVGQTLNIVSPPLTYLLTGLTTGVQYVALLYANNNAGSSAAADLPRTTIALASNAACVTFVAK